jgi:hypothetical protein
MDGHASGIDVESRGSCPAMTSCSRAASSTVRVTGADLVERRGERDRAVAAHRAVRGLDAHRAGDVARAGGSSRPCRCRAPGAPRSSRRMPPSRRRSRRGCARGPTGCGSGPYAECSVDDPIANSSMLVLPSGIMPASRTRRTGVGVVGRDPALEDARTRRSRACPRSRGRP